LQDFFKTCPKRNTPRARTLRSRKCPLSAQGAISRKQSLTILAVCRHVDLCRWPFRAGGDLRETRRTSGIGLQTVSDVGVFLNEEDIASMLLTA